MDLEQWAERHDGLITRAVARRAVSERELRTRMSKGIWRSARRGVVAVSGSPRTWRQAVRAVILSCGGRVAASHLTALVLLGGEVPKRLPVMIHVVGRPGRSVRLKGVVHHRSVTVAGDDIRRRDGIACTSAVVTVIHLSGMLTEHELGKVVDDFLRRRVLRLGELRARVATTRAAPGIRPSRLHAVLRARIPGYDPGESVLEARIARIIAAHRIRRPVQQFRIAAGGHHYRLDFAWPDRRVYLEGNGFGAHHLASDLDGDARRQNHLVADGWRPMEITWRMTDAEILRTFEAFGLLAV